MVVIPNMLSTLNKDVTYLLTYLLTNVLMTKTTIFRRGCLMFMLIKLLDMKRPALVNIKNSFDFLDFKSQHSTAFNGFRS